MKRMMVLLVVLFSPALFAGQPVQESEKSRCDKQHAQCMKQCDKEKSFWMFKGEKYDTCADKCTARQNACAAMPDEAASGARDHDAHRDKDDRMDHDDDAMEDSADPQDDDAMDDAMGGDEADDGTDSDAADDDGEAGKNNRGRKDRGGRDD